MFDRHFRLAVIAAGLFAVAGVTGCMSHEADKGDKGGCSCMKKEMGEKKEKENEMDIAVDQVPPAVVATVMKEVPGGTITAAEKEMKKGMTMYEVDVKAGDMPYEVKTAEDGSFLSKKLDKDEKDEKDEKGEKGEMKDMK